MIARTVALVIVRRVLGVLGCGPTPEADAVEIAVLRRQLAVLRRQVPGAWYTPADRMLLAVLAKLLPGERWGGVPGHPVDAAAVAPGVGCPSVEVSAHGS